MKNLCVFDVSSKFCDPNLLDHESCKICYGHNEENPTGEVYICSHNLTVSNLDENGINKWNKDLTDVASPENLPIDITFLSLPNVLCIGLRNGELFTLEPDGNNCNLAGVCDYGLLAMEWSPDQELLVLVTKNFKTILMSCSFDPIQEVSLFNEEFGEKQFITVGWGKKETQFHGTEGKQAAKTKNEIKADSNSSDTSVKISWRGDGQFFAVGFNMGGLRRFKIFDRDCLLQYTSEKQQGLESNMSWRPSGNVIATTQRISDDKYDISFFEKNGLKHGGFSIPSRSTSHVKNLAWSADSEILALLCVDSSNDVQQIMLFTTKNYHWYLKQSLEFSPEKKVVKIIWDSNFDVVNNKKLHVFLISGEILTYTWIWNIDHSVGGNDNDDGVVAVIDGSKILLTGFRQTVVPPPMSALDISLDTTVNSVSFLQNSKTDDTSNNFLICTSNSALYFYQQTDKHPLQYQQTKSITLGKYLIPFQCYNWQWVNEDTIICIEVRDGVYNLMEYNTKKDSLVLTNTISLPCAVTRSQPEPTEPNKILLQLTSGEILRYTLGGYLVPLEESLPTSCPQFCAVSIDNELHLFGMSFKGTFYIDGLQILNNVSSFFVHTHFLLLTTLKHFLLCIELTKSGLNALKEIQKNESLHVYKRKIERGSTLVIAIPNDTRTVLQLPRGNLEAIQPRPLSLKIIGEYLDNLKYHNAFDLMRKQRINLNLIHDHNPEKFFQYIDLFLDNIKNNSWLSLFLSELENVDVTKTMYSSSYANNISKTNGFDGKIDNICDVIRAHLAKREDREYKILPLLTTFVKRNTTTDLENALILIKKLKEQETGGTKLPVGSDEALKYLLYMVEVNKLFDVSLGMYDFDLVLLVANKSQKDPKEYIPMLNELNEMEENFKRFTINKHLKRFDRAVECLANCGPEKYGELRSFVKYHSLYKKALELFTVDDEIYRQISEDFGLYLTLKKEFTEAGIIYRRAKLIDKAVECFKDALEWELAIELAHNWPKNKLTELCRELVSGLQDEKRHKEALTILEQFCDNSEENIQCAIESSQYRSALRLCSQCNREDLKNERLLPALLKEYGTTQELIQTNWLTFIRYRDRLTVVRENKLKEPVEIFDPSYANKDSDLYSDAGSTLASSRSSSKTYRSSKNRRKHERKVASLKEGSQYEDVALVMALHTLVMSTYELRRPVREVLVALSCFGKDKEAFILQKSLEKLLKEIKDSLKEIWTSELVLEATNAEIAANNVPEGCNIIPQGIATLDAHMRIAPVLVDISWKLEGFN